MPLGSPASLRACEPALLSLLGLRIAAAILHSLRSGYTNVTSVLMDEETLLAYRDLWVPEPKPATGTYPTLTPGEQRVLERIRSDGNVRLEQERITWAHALAELVEAASRVPEDEASPVTS